MTFELLTIPVSPRVEARIWLAHSYSGTYFTSSI